MDWKVGLEGVTNRMKDNYGLKGWIKEKNEKDGEKGWINIACIFALRQNINFSVIGP